MVAFLSFGTHARGFLQVVTISPLELAQEVS